MRVKTLPNDDNQCGWINCLPRRVDFQNLKGSKKADWVILGAGYTGLAAARQLSHHFPDCSIALVDAQLAGEGASGRNSGYAVDLSPSPNKTITNVKKTYEKAYRLNMHGLGILKSQVNAFGIECDWAEVGKFHCAAEDKNFKYIESFASHLSEFGAEYSVYDHEALTQRLGTPYYKFGIHTHKAVMVQPAALSRGLALSLPEQVTLYENSPVVDINYGPTITLTTPEGSLETPNLILATNAFLPQSGKINNRLLSLTLTASLTRPLTEDEQAVLGHPDPWGLLSVHKFGATVRYTSDHRIMIRNTAEYWPNMAMDQQSLNQRVAFHEASFKARFPMLPDVSFDYSWSGVICTSTNQTSTFGELDSNVYVAGCYNAGGISRGTALGTLIADYIANVPSDALDSALALNPPGWIPPRPFLDIGVTLDLARRRFGVGKEV